MTQDCRRAALALALLFGSAHPLLADQVRVTAGFFSATTHEGPSFDFSGSGLTVADVNYSPNRPQFDLAALAPFFGYCSGACEPGETIRLGGSTIGPAEIGLANLTVNGTSYAGVRVFLDGVFSAGDAIAPGLPPFPTATLEVSAPFWFSGSLRALQGDEEVFRSALTGAGRAVARLEVSGGGTFEGEDQAIFYRFEEAAPVPEPGSMLLIGTGLAALAAARKRSVTRDS